MAREQQPRQPIAGLPGPAGRHRGARIEKARDTRRTVRRLLATLRPFRWALIGVFVLVIASTLLGLLGPYLIGVAIDQFIALDDLDGLQRSILLLLAAYLGNWLAMAGQSRIMASVSQKVMRLLRRGLFEHLLKHVPHPTLEHRQVKHLRTAFATCLAHGVDQPLLPKQSFKVGKGSQRLPVR